MSLELAQTEVKGLLGPFALDALDFDERYEVRSHMVLCLRCRAAVGTYREAAALAAGAVVTASAPIRDRIARRLELAAIRL